MRLIGEYPVLLREAWSAHELFRSLGFAPGDIFLGTDLPGLLCVTLLAQGKEHRLVVGKLEAKDVEQCLADWRQLASELHAQKEDDLQLVYRGSRVFEKKTTVLSVMVVQGFVFPFRVN